MERRRNSPSRVFFFENVKNGKYSNGALTRGLARDGEEGGDPQGCPPGDGVDVHPEGDPGDDHDEDGGDVRLDHVEADRARKVEAGNQAAVVSYKNRVGK